MNTAIPQTVLVLAAAYRARVELELNNKTGAIFVWIIQDNETGAGARRTYCYELGVDIATVLHGIIDSLKA